MTQDIGSTYTKCPDCLSLYVASPDGTMHQKDCPKAIEGDDADKMRDLIGKITIGTWSDTLIAVMGPPIQKPVVLGLSSSSVGGYVVDWLYKGVTYTLARGVGSFNGQQMFVYAVQRMQFNAEGKHGKRQRKLPKYK